MYFTFVWVLYTFISSSQGGAIVKFRAPPGERGAGLGGRDKSAGKDYKSKFGSGGKGRSGKAGGGHKGMKGKGTPQKGGKKEGGW